jgi:hypothetical protein
VFLAPLCYFLRRKGVIVMKSQHTIRSRADLDDLNPYRRQGRRLRFQEIKLAIPSLSPSDLAAKEERLNRAYFACGCAEATLFGLAALIGIGIWITLRPVGWMGLTWSDLGYTATAFFLATGAGKWVGLQRARWSLRREVVELGRYLKEEPREPIPSGRCGIS